MSSNGTLLVEAIATLAVLIHAYWAWALALVATLTVLLLALVAVLNSLYDHCRTRKDQPTMTVTEVTGEYGTAHRVPASNYAAVSPAALDSWIITAPCWHPLWTQYALALVSLAHIPDVPPAKLHRPGMTHEINVMALNPEHGPYDARTLSAGRLRYLTPGNVAEQFTTTDELARHLTQLCAQAVVDGRLCPETADAPERIRTYWQQAIRDTLGHHHDPRHGHLT
ncbi:hypothetical protein [Streptomyces sp. NPDC088847]|uniref:hypothetical protein n=1 Tax=Streptomyces sp. NPDC088847 TaxID=3365909 RepID=UPI00382A26BA